MATMFTVQDFFRRFPTDEACLKHIFRIRHGLKPMCPKCQRPGKFYKLSKEPAYSCEWCGHHIHPMVGTPFQRSRTSLQKWFFAMYLFSMSRNGVSAKELQRQLGVTYKAAWRIGHEIRKYMALVDGDGPLSGHISKSMKRTSAGRSKDGKTGRGASGKTIVLGMAERDGDVLTRIVPNVKRTTLVPLIVDRVKAGSRISTDEMKSYHSLGKRGFLHAVVAHARGRMGSRRNSHQQP